MGFFKNLFNKDDKATSPQLIDRRKIPSEEIDRMQRLEASKAYRKKIYRLFYPDYPELPYISQDREFNTNWIEQAEMFPHSSIIARETMTRYSDGLLPGHVYMLYWIKNIHRKRIPSYFEYKYGIDFETEKRYLSEHGYLDTQGKLTNKGEQSIQEHIEVVKNHAPKKDRTIAYVTKQILEQKQAYMEMGFDQYTFHSNSNCCDICKSLNGKHFKFSDLSVGSNAPPMHDGCQCSISPYEDEEEYQAWLNFLSRGGTTEEWERLKQFTKD